MIPTRHLRALELAVGNAVGTAHEHDLICLLRVLDPDSIVLAAMDRIAREHGYVAAGSPARLGPYAITLASGAYVADATDRAGGPLEHARRFPSAWAARQWVAAEAPWIVEAGGMVGMIVEVRS